MFMSSRKRQKTSGSSAYRDSVDIGDGYDLIHAREGRARHIGRLREVRNVPTERSPQRTTQWSDISTWGPPDDLSYALEPDGVAYDEAVSAEVMEEELSAKPKKKYKKSKVSKRPHVFWKTLHRQSYLDEIIQWEGRGDFIHARDCPDCLSRNASPCGLPEFRCRECFLPDLLCSACCVRRHRLQPFHRIQKWNGSMFIKTSLKEMGLTVQLNHTGMYCGNPTPCHSKISVLHTNGFHDVSIQYCGCSRAIPIHLQLLRRGLYPSSQLTPKTCATFESLRHLHLFALTTKASTYDFYRALDRLTDNTGLSSPTYRYKALFRMVLQWRHLKMLKWGGRSNDPSGVAGTGPGELAIRCPSCPYPSINLPQGWEDVPDNLRFLYMMIICMDANFRLKNQIVSNYSQDPGLGVGWAYMVDREPYERYVLSRANDKDISTCAGFQALAKANTKFSTGLRYTGVGAVVCGRSEMVLPLGVGNLQKGERYANMDYIFGSAIRGAWSYDRSALTDSDNRYIVASAFYLLLLLVSYDIVCQWFVNLSRRMNDHWPESIKMPPFAKLVPAIPKLHEPMHSTEHQMYSLNYIPGVGESDCECPERFWGPHNILGNATKTQGPGSRQDVLDDHFNFWNWLKYTGLGVRLAKKYKAAVAERNIQGEAHRGLTASLETGVAEKWEKICRDWEEDEYPKKKKNPYRTEGLEITSAQVRKELAEEETERIERGGTSLHATSDSAFVILGLDLEDSQRRLRRLAKNPGRPTDRKEGSLAEQRNHLRARIRAWELLHPIYMPGLLQYITDLAASSPSASTSKSSDNPEDAQIWLPSQLPSLSREKICVPGLPMIEERLRTAQCHDALDNVRHVLKVKSRMVFFKNKNIRGQRDGTKSRALIDRVHERARLAAQKYRWARAAKLELAGHGNWEETLRVLEDGDLRSYRDPNHLRPRQARQGILDDEQLAQAQEIEGGEEQAQASVEMLDDAPNTFLFNQARTRRDGTGESRRTLSWIWISKQPDNDEEQDDILRSEWAKSRARASRTQEEVLLIKEEMRRILEFFAWKSKTWRAKMIISGEQTVELREGRAAFALKQADIHDHLAIKFKALWGSSLQEVPTKQNCRADANMDNNSADAGRTNDNGDEHNDNSDDDPEEDDDVFNGPDDEDGDIEEICKAEDYRF